MSPLFPQTASPKLSTQRQPGVRILVAPSGFKESLGPDEVADCIEEGIRRILPESSALIRKVPLHDGGEGFCRALVAAQRGGIHNITVMGPTGEPVESHFGMIGGDSAVLDMATAAGLRLVPRNCRDPTVTTTFGVGQLMAAAVDQGCRKIIIGCGDSGTSDGGSGLLQALGAKLIDASGEEIPTARGGGSLANLDRIDMSGLHPRLRAGKVKIEAICNIKNVLCGPNGVARIFGPQKGATPQQVETLSKAMDNVARAAKAILGKDIGDVPGSGASGGLGAGLLLLGAELRPRSEAADEYFGLRNAFEKPWDVVITGEGSLDSQSARGKMTVEIARRARKLDAQVIVLAGTIGNGAESIYDAGVAAFTSILDGPYSLEQAIKNTDRLLKDAAERSVRMLLAGMSLSSNNKKNKKKEQFPSSGPSYPGVNRNGNLDTLSDMKGLSRSVTC
ncbi:hypothetical protein DL766_001172 [Monosporascus sp. MC13-8B]|uniref:Glycerate kinase n=1 Tax=Monosporascus cannonballus TaxID=155416 RepID=A0ABY0HCN1_9PEZI|nr:hypothetical protein DL762_002695 [Monosporascus cannonballus]RYO97673.1 hypothetical protein DL763_002650 [Monosporascus cannonballus]RYP38093.1 hypothetical protein DL766_001172 [Monosporascus sp. MC13-8B]